MPSPGAESLRARRMARLLDARLYLCTARRGDEGSFLEDVLGLPGAPAVDLVQLREKGLEWREELAGLARMREAADRVGALVSANDRADVAAFAGVDILHVGQDDIPPRLARTIVGADALIGLSTHDPEQFLAALADPDVDYVCVGPVHATPTKEGRPPVGMGLPRLAARHAPPFEPGAKPWFVTGGVDARTLDAILETGARRVVVVRGITEAADPGAAATALAERLRSA
ncbi:thiamine phosphate synthase [Frankia sp. Mgl5]|uniref:thiamine phosphate synthase n=1 Tax=Frankia sp. Mgl5 TaxID=2933793 RepID=UPI00200EB4DB|nr:thiamine phosphate synthase [Frankia sp. Mgl5]MCK9928742.1 thiamine phosphate synthase [Frankia sp. Mgl5]